MQVPYEATGRRNQKARTRSALIDAARDLVAAGGTPTVEEAAAAASVSRTTAYRYFPNQRALLVAAHPEIEAESLLGDDPPEDPAGRLALALEEFTRILVENETELRTTLRLSLEPDAEAAPLLRRGRAIGWFEEALAPLRGRLGDAGLRRLAVAIRAACGIEALVWLTDVAGLSRPEAVELMRWSADALLRRALEAR